MCHAMSCIQELLGLIIITGFQLSLQHCPEEVIDSEVNVTWHQSEQAEYVPSEPVCIYNGRLITRNCTNDEWVPPLREIISCQDRPTAIQNDNFDRSLCPPGFHSISEHNHEYCYQITKPSEWDFPCTESGGATVITELSKDETESLLVSLNSTRYKQFWLPAQRQKIFAPMVWSTPGPNWGRIVTVNDKIIPLEPAFLKHCLLLDIQNKILLTDTCSKRYPSLCLFVNDFHSPVKCPDNYYAYRFMVNDSRCFGIEKSDKELNYKDFLDSKCNSPMGNGQYSEFRRFIYSKVAEASAITNDTWCWYASPYINGNNFPIDQQVNITNTEFHNIVSVINNEGSTGLMHRFSKLKCIACEKKLIIENTELTLEYNQDQENLYLIVYFPSGLWKYSYHDRGIQCFSDSKGFFRVIDVNELPLVDVTSMNSSQLYKILDVEKVIYVINLVTNSSARYWCEGHTKKLDLITTEKIVVNPQGNRVHVFSLVLKLYKSDSAMFNVSHLTDSIQSIFRVRKVLVMDILNYDTETVDILVHLHVVINNTYEDESLNLQETLYYLKQKAETEFPIHNYTFINISSSVYCLPTTSFATIHLDWDLTSIGSIASPKQFCLQSNGLPVNRKCLGSYMLGGSWGDIEGVCDFSYQPSFTTKFLFNFTQGNVETNQISKFLTAYLRFFLKDLDNLIPADIYYLSLSFQHILNIAKHNICSVETGDIENMSWIMDRMMNVNNKSLHLAQSLNSTNIILDTINDMIEFITENNFTINENKTVENTYQIAIQPKFIVQVSFPEFTNITGIALIGNSETDKFTDMIVQPLYKNTTFEEVLSINNLDVATWVPEIVLDNLRNNRSESSYNSTTYMNVVINIYYSNSIFQELTKTRHTVNSRIVEVTIPGYTTNLEYSMPLIFREVKSSNLPKVCGYWDFHSGKGNIPGTWCKRGCYLKLIVNNLTVCECYHLTHFAQLINLNSRENFQNYTAYKRHEKALNMITLIGSFLSIIGITGIWVTASVFETWRKKAGTKVLLQLCGAIALPLFLIIFFNLNDSVIIFKQGKNIVPSNMIIICVSLGALFHYSVLSNFMWMLITAVFQFIRYVRVFGIYRPTRFMIKLTLIGWGLPSIPVLIVLLINYKNYIPDPSSGRSFCYPNGIMMVVSLILPVCIILIINIVLFLLVIRSISKSTDLRVTDKSLVFAQFRLSIFLFFLLGLTWIFGIASFSGSLIWSYLFCLTSTLQGFVLFVYFVICDPTTRNMWIMIMKPQFTRSRSSLSTISSG